MAQAAPKKIVLAYSGGLDTSVILPWLKDRYPGVKLVAFAAELGQGDDRDVELPHRGLGSPASADEPRPDREAHLAQLLGVASGGVVQDAHRSLHLGLGQAIACRVISQRHVLVAARAGDQTIDAHAGGGGRTGKARSTQDLATVN